MCPVISRESCRILNNYEVISDGDAPIKIGSLTVPTESPGPASPAHRKKREIIVERFYFGNKPPEADKNDDYFFIYVKNGAGSQSEKLEMSQYPVILGYLRKNGHLNFLGRSLEKYAQKS